MPISANCHSFVSELHWSLKSGILQFIWLDLVHYLYVYSVLSKYRISLKTYGDCNIFQIVWHRCSLGQNKVAFNKRIGYTALVSICVRNIIKYS